MKDAVRKQEINELITFNQQYLVLQYAQQHSFYLTVMPGILMHTA
jgi:hypothetical protein